MKEKKEVKSFKFSDTILNFAMIVKGELDDIKDLKKIIESEVNKKNIGKKSDDTLRVKLIYQKMSPKKLWIEEEHEEVRQQ